MTKYTYYRLAQHFLSRPTCATELSSLYLYLKGPGKGSHEEVRLTRALIMQRGLRDYGFITDRAVALEREEWSHITEEPQSVSDAQAILLLTRYFYYQTGSCYFKDFIDFRKSIVKKMPPEAASEYLYEKYIASLESPWRPSLPAAPYSSSACHSPSELTATALVDEILAAHRCIAASTVKNTEVPHNRVTVDIIIPVYGKIDFTLRCIHSVLMDIADIAAAGCMKAIPSIIVVDDTSPMQEGIEELSILHANGVCMLVQNRSNIGYLRSCNEGARNSSGQYLVFLNNDTNVCHGWLQSLLRTFEFIPSAGLVGSKLLYPNGLLQEAGGIVWRDGSAWNYGRGQDPLNPEYSYMRSVDYISGASIAIRRELFNELGGFDTRYAPAYYEDTDLCFKVKEAGYKVLLQPCSQVVHHEGISCGKDTSSGVKKYQLVNQRRFFLRWHKKLLEEHEGKGKCTLRAKNRGMIGRCLVIETTTLTPDQDAGSRFVMDYCIVLGSLGYEVSYLPVGNFHYWPDKTPLLQGYGIRVLYSPFVTSIDEAFKTNQDGYDFCIVCRPEQADVLEQIRVKMGRKPIFYFTHDIHHRRMHLENKANPGSHSDCIIDKTRVNEIKAIELSTCTIHISKEEESFMNSTIQHDSVVIRPMIEAGSITERSSNSKTIIFIGSARHSPNPDAIYWFASQILPIIQSRIDCNFLIAGGGYAPALRASVENSSVRFLGFVENLDTLYNNATISVAPLRFGAGVKGKIVESFAYGLPCVMTEIASEGLEIEAESILEHCIARYHLNPKDFADRCVQLLSNSALHSKMSIECLAHHKKYFSRSACAQSWIDLLNRYGLPHLGGTSNISKGYNSREKVCPIKQDMVINGWDIYQYAKIKESPSYRINE